MNIYYLNLDSRTDRRAFMERQFAATAMSARRVMATSPAEIAPELLERHSGTGRLLPVELACSLSHQSAWKQMLSDGQSSALVLEDDVFVSTQLGSFLKGLANAPLPHDIIRIETRQGVAKVSAPLRTIGTIRLHRFHNYEIGSSGYVISADCARRLLQDDGFFDCPVDDALFSPRSPLFSRLDVVRTLPGLCIPAEYVLGFGLPGVQRSDIHASRLENRAGVEPGLSWWQGMILRRRDDLVRIWTAWYRLADRLGFGGSQRFVRFEP